MSEVKVKSANGILSADGKEIPIIVYFQHPKGLLETSRYAYLKGPELSDGVAKAVRRATLVNGKKTRDVTAYITSTNALGGGPPFFVKLGYA